MVKKIVNERILSQDIQQPVWNNYFFSFLCLHPVPLPAHSLDDYLEESFNIESYNFLKNDSILEVDKVKVLYINASLEVIQKHIVRLRTSQSEFHAMLLMALSIIYQEADPTSNTLKTSIDLLHVYMLTFSESDSHYNFSTPRKMLPRLFYNYFSYLSVEKQDRYIQHLINQGKRVSYEDMYAEILCKLANEEICNLIFNYFIKLNLIFCKNVNFNNKFYLHGIRI